MSRPDRKQNGAYEREDSCHFRCPVQGAVDYDTRARLEGIDLILSCGDLPKKYLEYLTNFTAAPILYVHGNHDGSYQTQGEPGGCICVDDQVYTWKGLRIMGLGGCQRYNKEDTYQYTEKAMRRRVHKLKHQAHKRGGIDLLLTHAPAKGLNDGDDCATGALSASTRFWTSTSLNGSSTGTYT